MASTDTAQLGWLESRGCRGLLVIAFSVATGIYFFLQFVFRWNTPVWMAILIPGVGIGAPMVLAYLDWGFMETTATGLLPYLGYQLGTWFDVQQLGVRTAQVAHNVSWVLVTSVFMGLPFVTFTYIAGVGLRSRDDLRDQAVPLGSALCLSIVVFFVGLYLLDTVRIGIDQ